MVNGSVMPYTKRFLSTLNFSHFTIQTSSLSQRPLSTACGSAFADVGIMTGTGFFTRYPWAGGYFIAPVAFFGAQGYAASLVPSALPLLGAMLRVPPDRSIGVPLMQLLQAGMWNFHFGRRYCPSLRCAHQAQNVGRPSQLPKALQHRLHTLLLHHPTPNPSPNCPPNMSKSSRLSGLGKRSFIQCRRQGHQHESNIMFQWD